MEPFHLVRGCDRAHPLPTDRTASLLRREWSRFIWYEVATAVAVSAAAVGGLVVAGIELEDRAEQIFEAAMLILAAGFLTGMILWMQRQGASWRGVDRERMHVRERDRRLGVVRRGFPGRCA